MHTHAGMYRDTQHVRDALVRNDVLLITCKIIGDGAVIERVPGERHSNVSSAGELANRYEATLHRLKAQHQDENLFSVASAESLAIAMRGTGPAVAIGVEGGDLLEGDLKRLESARLQGIVHLQLVHYRVSELGDISTERSEHHGLTSFGKDVVAACNRLGILVDVAHGTSEVIEQVLAVSTKPDVYSHGHITSASPYYTQGNTRARAIHRPLAQKIAKRSGIIGIWPLGNLYPTLDAYAQTLIETAEYLGANHVAVGSDIPIPVRSVMPNYEAYPALEELLQSVASNPTISQTCWDVIICGCSDRRSRRDRRHQSPVKTCITPETSSTPRTILRKVVSSICPKSFHPSHAPAISAGRSVANNCTMSAVMVPLPPNQMMVIRNVAAAVG